MKRLIVFDAQINFDRLKLEHLKPGDSVYLFPLTSRISLINALREKIGFQKVQVHVLPSSEINSQTADKLRDKYLDFIANFPDKVRGKNLREYFAIDDDVSLWWFSLVAEKSTLKSDAFNRLVQLFAIIHVYQTYQIDEMGLGFQGAKLKQAVMNYARAHGWGIRALPVYPFKNFKGFFNDFHGYFYLKHLVILIFNILVLLKRGLVIRKTLRTLPRKKLDPKAIMLITYYPYLDLKKAKEGRFENKFYSGLDQALRTDGQTIAWIAIYVSNNSVTFREAIQYARQFIKQGEIIYFLEEFISIKDYIKVGWLTWKSSLKFLSKEKEIRSLTQIDGIPFMDLLKDDYYSSFCGITGFSGILYYLMFKGLFQKIHTRKGFYFLEMQAWEKAMISANQAAGKDMELYGYQHATIPPLLLSYFHAHKEIALDEDYRMPRPTKIICNSEITYGYMKNCGWPEDDLLIAEAIRYNHLKQYAPSTQTVKKNIVLVVCSISPEESSALLNIAHHSIKNLKNVDLWVRPHPFLNMNKLFQMAEIPETERTYKLMTGPLDQLLAEVKILIVGGSGVAIESLAFGCKVIIVEVPEWINMSPLRGIESLLIKRVTTAEQLSESIKAMINESFDIAHNLGISQSIIKRFFNLSAENDIPQKLVSCLEIDK